LLRTDNINSIEHVNNALREVMIPLASSSSALSLLVDYTGKLQDSESKQSKLEKYAPAQCKQTDSHTISHLHRCRHFAVYFSTGNLLSVSSSSLLCDYFRRDDFPALQLEKEVAERATGSGAPAGKRVPPTISSAPSWCLN
jgi:hypothetical protein